MLQTSVKNSNDQYNTNLKQMLFDEAFLLRSENTLIVEDCALYYLVNLVNQVEIVKK